MLYFVKKKSNLLVKKYLIILTIFYSLTYAQVRLSYFWFIFLVNRSITLLN